MESVKFVNERNDESLGEMPLIVPNSSQHQTNMNILQLPANSETRQIPRNDSAGTITELSLSRRPSAVVSSIRRSDTSGNITLQRSLLIEYVGLTFALLERKKYIWIFLGFHCSLLHGRLLSGSKTSIRPEDNEDDFVHLEPDPEFEQRLQNRRIGNDALTTALSAFYAKLLVVLGIAFPVTDILATKSPSGFYQGFYLYLYIGSVLFVAFMYVAHIRSRQMYAIVNNGNGM